MMKNQGEKLTAQMLFLPLVIMPEALKLTQKVNEFIKQPEQMKMKHIP